MHDSKFEDPSDDDPEIDVSFPEDIRDLSIFNLLALHHLGYKVECVLYDKLRDLYNRPENNEESLNGA